jgi:serine/threonine protein kinase
MVSMANAKLWQKLLATRKKVLTVDSITRTLYSSITMSTVNFTDSPIALPGDESTSVDTEENKPGTESLPDTSSIELISLVLHCGHPQIHVLGDFILACQNNSPRVRPHSLGRGTFCDVTTHCVTAEEAVHLPHLRTGDMVAYKRYQVRDRANSSQNQRNHITEMRRELRILLHPVLRDHRNISKLLYIGWENNALVPILVSRLADYGNLEDFLSSADKYSVTDAERLLLTMDIASGLHALRQLYFTHRDLKMSNVLVDSCPSNGIRGILTDFSGSIEHAPGVPVIDKGHYTPEWAAPEELTGYCNDAVDIYDYRLCDVYSFGTIVATLWIEEYIKPLSPVPCFLLSYCTETNGTTGKNQSKSLERIKKRPDDVGDSVISIALAKLSVNGASLVGDILRLTLCREAEERVQMDRILLELGFPNVNERAQRV